MDRGAWRVTVHRVTKESDRTEGLTPTHSKWLGIQCDSKEQDGTRAREFQAIHMSLLPEDCFSSLALNVSFTAL